MAVGNFGKDLPQGAHDWGQLCCMLYAVCCMLVCWYAGLCVGCVMTHSYGVNGNTHTVCYNCMLLLGEQPATSNQIIGAISHKMTSISRNYLAQYKPTIVGGSHVGPYIRT